MNWFPTRWRCDAHAVWRAGGVLVGRGVAGRGAGAARGSRSSGWGAVGSAVAGADRGCMGAGRAGSWAPVDLDGDLRAVDGDQAAHWLGLRDAGAGGLRLAASAAVLSDRDRSACAGRVDGPQARPPAGRRGRAGDHQGGDREGPARDAFPCAGGEDRLDGRGGRHPLPVRRDARLARRQGARARGPQAHGDDQGQHDAGQGSFAFGWAGGSRDLQDARAAHRRSQSGGDDAQRAGRAS